MSVNKLERLLNLTAVLLNTSRPLSAEEIRDRVEGYPDGGTAFHRAFERDKDDLRVLGIPLRVERVPATNPPLDGYRIDPADYYLPDPGLEPDELAALHLASLAIRIEGLADQEAFWKLGGAGTGVDGSPQLGELFDPGTQVATIPSDPNLVVTFQAIADGRAVRFTYNEQTRLVDPWRLDFHRGRWYATGHDHVRGAERNYRLDRIEGAVEVTDQAIEHPAPPPISSGPLRPWEVGEEEPVVARLLVDPSHVLSVKRQLGEAAAIEERDNGSAVFSVPVVSFDAFRYFVLGLLEHAELLEPTSWRAQIIDWLETLAGSADSRPPAPERTEVGS